MATSRTGTSYFGLKDDKKFKKWFWEGSNANNLIKALNECSPKDRTIRIENQSPFIYGIIVKITVFGGDFLFIKIGHTRGDDNSSCLRKRIQKAKNDIAQKLRSRFKMKGEIMEEVFIFRVSTVFKAYYCDIEKTLRNQWGRPLTKKEAKSVALPVPTKWALTNQKCLDAFTKFMSKKYGTSAATHENNPLSTDVFEDEELKIMLEGAKSSIDEQSALEFFSKCRCENNKQKTTAGNKDTVRETNPMANVNQSATIYGIIIKGDIFKSDFIFMKIGETANPNSLKKKIKRAKRDINVKLQDRFRMTEEITEEIFVCSINAPVDACYREIEDKIRKQWGMVLSPTDAKSIDLPVPTEWVLTHQSCLEAFARFMNKSYGNAVAIDVRNLLSADLFEDEELKRSLDEAKISIDAESAKVFISECRCEQNIQETDTFSKGVLRQRHQNEDSDDECQLKTKSASLQTTQN